MSKNIKSFLDNNGIEYEENASLKKKTWIKTGGICSLWVIPKCLQELELLCTYLYLNEYEFDIVGQTSNIFFHSTYNPEIVISTLKLNNYKIVEDVAICECGVKVIRLAKEMLKEGYEGFYGLVGLPGTVGAALVNNSGCFNCSISGIMIEAKCLMSTGEVRILKKNDFGYNNRTSSFKSKTIKGVILSVKIRLVKAANTYEEQMKSLSTIKHRKLYQEGAKLNLGSIFSNMKIRKSIKYKLAMIISRILRPLFYKDNNCFNRCLLYIYGYKDLIPYISEKTLNTFIWKNEKSEEKFYRYKKFMSKICYPLNMEIEEKK